MRYVLIVMILLSASSAFAQQQNIERPSPQPQEEKKSKVPEDCVSGTRVEGCRFAMPLPSLEEFLNSGNRLVFVEGALRISGLGGLYAAPGGGSSGCFSADLNKRVERLRDFTPKLPDVAPPMQENDYWRFRGQRVLRQTQNF